MSDAEKEITFDEVWEELKANDTTGIFQRAEEAAAQSVADIEYAFDSGYKHGFMDAKDMISKEIEKRCLEHLGDVPLWLSMSNIKPEDKRDE